MRRVLAFVDQVLRGRTWRIIDIDATGQRGDALTKEANAHLPLYVSTHDLLKIVEEQGQVTELRGELTMENGSYIRLYVMDGGSVDVVACGIDIPHDVLGEYVDVDPSYFGP